MQCVIPDIPQTRELDEGFRCEGDIGTNHVPDPSDFCKVCGADLHVIRLQVSRVSYWDVWRLRICQAAWESGPAGMEECNRLGISPNDRAKMVNLYLQGCETFEYVHCGLWQADIVGITANGMFLYAAPGEYEIGSETMLRD